MTVTDHSSWKQPFRDEDEVNLLPSGSNDFTSRAREVEGHLGHFECAVRQGTTGSIFQPSTPVTCEFEFLLGSHRIDLHLLIIDVKVLSQTPNFPTEWTGMKHMQLRNLHRLGRTHIRLPEHPFSETTDSLISKKFHIQLQNIEPVRYTVNHKSRIY